ncbi:MAG: hypothetical protein LUH54_00105, partial [Firmicutes bacterium]|nr:hypothetical protein [Bacillota bacterium]
MKDSRNHKVPRPLGKSGNVMLIIFAVLFAAVCAFALSLVLSLLNASGTEGSETSSLMTIEAPEYAVTSDTTEFVISATDVSSVTDVSSATDTAVTPDEIISDTTADAPDTTEAVTTEAVTSAAKDEETVTVTYKYAVYLGVKDYGTVRASDKDSFVHRFCVDGEEMLFTVATGASEDYAIQNILAEGYVYDLPAKDSVVTGAAASEPLAAGTIGSVSKDAVVVGTERISVDAGTEVYEITSLVGGAEVTAAEMTAGESVKVYGDSTARVIYLSFVADEYISPVSYTAGETTLKNFLAAAMQPVGTALYVYGGTWNWQDTGSGVLATTIGLSPTWIDFFESQTASYSYINRKDYSKSYYPHYSWNQYYYAGLDCSGYVAWTIYNTLNTESGGDGYVMSSTVMAKTLAEEYGYGTWTHTIESPDELCPGDIISIRGHVW